MAISNLLHKYLALAVTLTPLSVSVLADNNFNANYGTSPAPFQIDVHPSFINRTIQKVALTRFTVDVEEPELASGPPRHNATTVQDYWLHHYDWFRVQDQLNQRYHHFTTSVLTGPRSNFTNPVPLHFVHHRSNRTDAIPLLFIHGWPGSFMEVDHILDGLLNPPNASAPAFHVVAPSIPGFAFSPAPRKAGWGARETGYAFHALMEQLGYTHYVIQGGDFGGVILRYMAGDNPSAVLSVLDNMWIVPPNATDLERYSLGLTTADENTTIETINNFDSENSGYRLIQETKPLQAAIGMTDSPIGFAMWIFNLMLSAVDHYVWTPSEIITWSMMYYIQGPYGGMRFYKEVLREGGFQGFGLGDAYPYVHQPVAISEFPKDIWYGTPLDWARRKGNVVTRNFHYSGGHFAAVESPDLLLGDIRAFWGNSSLSNVSLFRS
ncbi:MAG: hypothetical protein HETSPECPRED_002970 [Heterodermia speciosa]|uniref:Epoxide hydrolase N-terminal domain-containing protein n=1 Tax=Heterodermia speciosa TaxID=116794 RepID=A0A8H3I6F7_9LECA|nr:MAG: hypothetical protein HETSPECPRED_002970 [Heterodermia speciosa]